MTLSKIIEQLKAADQNKTGMFELGEDVMCALVELLERRERDGQKPVYQCMEDGNWYDTEKRLYEEVKENGNMCRILYAAPPAPVVPDAIEPDYDVIKGILPTANPDEYACCIAADMWNSCRAAMLKQPSSIQTSDSASSGAKINQPVSNGGRS